MDSRSEVAIMQQKAEDRRRRLQQQLEDKQGYVGAYRARVVAKPSHLVFFCQQVVHLVDVISQLLHVISDKRHATQTTSVNTSAPIKYVLPDL